jgi:uracil-DNA glycosylase family 4
MNSRQLHCLRSMDIDVWQRRDLAHAASAVKQIDSIVATATDATQAFQRGLSAASTVAVHVTEVGAVQPSASPSLATWNDVEAAVRNCTQCTLHGSRTQTVFGVGNRSAQWMIIGEAPGADEDREGEPFVGRAGQLLNAMMLAIGLQREQVFIANILKCRPPGNRDPKPEEVNCCMPYLQRQIELVNPRIIVCVGRIAAQNLLSTDTPIGKLRGSVHYLGAARRPVVVTYHPAYLLRSPGEKRKAWDDLRFAVQTFNSAESVVV